MNRNGDMNRALRLPNDPALVGLSSLFDARWFGSAASQLLPDGLAPESCQPVYVRYKPGTNAVAVWSLTIPGQAEPLLVQGKCFAEVDFDAACDKAENTHWSEPALGLPLAVCRTERCLLLAFPNDPVLDGLRFAAHGKRMQRAIYAHVDSLPEADWRISDRRLTIAPVRFKPEKRAVLRLDTRAVNRTSGEKRALRLYLRVDADGRGAHDILVLDHIHRGLSTHPNVGSPRPVAYDAAHRLLIVEDAGGVACTGLDNATAMGTALASLHALPPPALPSRSFAAHLDSARDTVGTVGFLDAALAAPARLLLESLMNSNGDAAGPGCITHGDCHPGQLLLSGDRIVLLDFDRCHLGDPASDLGNYLAHVDMQALRAGRRDDGSTATAVLDAYAASGGRRPGERRLALWRALGLLQLSATPFRALDQEWPELTAAILARGQEALSCG